ncbi:MULTISPECIES: FmdB family zinc ribbon protein [unclassified Pseudofrankia]|uniref:FmdB family zinc ribbon protein n=1 Tax=unclassified Pseudofrankia TaxID=2994372 RepID=UPI0008DA4391|nr:MULTISPECIES: FmdB family zinc ribbon protein [unclassified Pseudofrankia]MDT3443715.1 zinc ribbon domain-containing protein [Pseudofrankia sp. BMG5.37]OHV42897.1 FmdB family transcriptional regulator [Pseudofrankia sp. BMG5.36]
MPTYQYRCTACGNDLEAVQSFSDPALTECPVCAGRLRKVFSSVGLVFKGSGFYKTDSRSGSSATAPAQRSKEAAADGGGNEAATGGGGKDTSSDAAKSTATPTAASASSSSTGSGGNAANAA